MIGNAGEGKDPRRWQGHDSGYGIYSILTFQADHALRIIKGAPCRFVLSLICRKELATGRNWTAAQPGVLRMQGRFLNPCGSARCRRGRSDFVSGGRPKRNWWLWTDWRCGLNSHDHFLFQHTFQHVADVWFSFNDFGALKRPYQCGRARPCCARSGATGDRS